MFVYNHTFRNYLHYLKGARLSVLMALSMHANNRNRCYPSQKYLAKETGHSISTVNSAISWLKEVGGIEIVPYDKRVGDDETKLPVRQHVYQLTGTINVDGVVIPYMYDSKSESQQPKPDEITDEQWGEFEITVAKILATKILMSVTKVIPSLSESKEISDDDEPLPDSGESQQPDPESEPSPAAEQKPKHRISDLPAPEPLPDDALDGLSGVDGENAIRVYKHLATWCDVRSLDAIRDYVQEFGESTVVELLQVVQSLGGSNLRNVDQVIAVYREKPSIKAVRAAKAITDEQATGSHRIGYFTTVLKNYKPGQEVKDTPAEPQTFQPWDLLDKYPTGAVS